MTLHVHPEGLPSAPLGECGLLATAEPFDGVSIHSAFGTCHLSVRAEGRGTSWSLLPNVLSLLTGSSGDDFRHATGVLTLARGELGAAWHPSQPLLSPQSLDEALKYCNYVFTIVFVFEAALKLVAFGFRRFFKDRCVVSFAGQVEAFCLWGEPWLSCSCSKPWPYLRFPQVEPAGLGHRPPVHHGHRTGGDRDERRPSHQPHHYPHHACAPHRPR